MPVIEAAGKRIDYLEEGAGEMVVLVHSSVSGNKQWRVFLETLKERYRVVAPNLFGYGETTPWGNDTPQTLAAQAELVLALCAESVGPVHLVGHSFGGAVALKAAALLGERVGKLVLFEPILSYLLLQHGRHEAYGEAKSIADHVQQHGGRGDWLTAAGRFADYWLGEGAWAEMPEKRQVAFASAIRCSVHEFDAVLGEATGVGLCRELPAKTLVMHDTTTRRTIREIVGILRDACPHWTFRSVTGMGHMAPLTHPQAINPIIEDFIAS